MSKFDENCKFKTIRSPTNPKCKKMKKTKVFEVMLYIFGVLLNIVQHSNLQIIATYSTIID